jgi:peptidoglycan/LPS O-acetylase OafA/YrhL
MLEILCDVVRGLAALWVFTYHFRPSREGIWLLASVGDLGVPAFFVISGFCILSAAQRTRTKNQSVVAFLKRRLVRIYPPFWASIVVVLAVPFIIGTFSGYWVKPLWYSYTWQDWLLVISLGRIFFGHGQPLYTTFVNVNAVYWSLAIEVQFYLVIFAALVWRRHFNRILIGTTVAGFAALTVPALRSSGLFLAYWPLFSVGMGLKWVLDRPVPKFWKPGLVAAVAAMVAVIVSDIVAPKALPDMIYPLVFATAIGLVLWMVAPLDRHFAFRPLLWLGSVSYSIYLLHTLVSQIPTAALQNRMTPDTVPFKALVLVLTLIPIYGFYRIAEKPFISTSGMVRPLGVPLELGGVVVDLPQISSGVSGGLVVEMLRGRVSGLAASRHSSRSHGRSELDDRDEAVAAGSVPLFGVGVGAGSE